MCAGMVEIRLCSLCNLCILCLDWVRPSRKVKNPTNPTAVSWSESVASFCSLSSILEVVKSSASCSSTLQDPSGYAATPLPHGNLRPKYRGSQLSNFQSESAGISLTSASSFQRTSLLYGYTIQKKKDVTSPRDRIQVQVKSHSHLIPNILFLIEVLRMQGYRDE